MNNKLIFFFFEKDNCNYFRQLQKVDKIETENRKYTIVVLFGTNNIQYCQLLNEFLLHTVTKIRKTNVRIVNAWC